MIHDNDCSFSKAFNAIFKSEGIYIIHTPFQAPNANAHAERWVRTVREECLDHILIINAEHLQRVLIEFSQYYNTSRPIPTTSGEESFIFLVAFCVTVCLEDFFLFFSLFASSSSKIRMDDKSAD